MTTYLDQPRPPRKHPQAFMRPDGTWEYNDDRPNGVLDDIRADERRRDAISGAVTFAIVATMVVSGFAIGWLLASWAVKP